MLGSLRRKRKSKKVILDACVRNVAVLRLWWGGEGCCGYIVFHVCWEGPWVTPPCPGAAQTLQHCCVTWGGAGPGQVRLRCVLLYRRRRARLPPHAPLPTPRARSFTSSGWGARGAACGGWPALSKGLLAPRVAILQAARLPPPCSQAPCPHAAKSHTNTWRRHPPPSPLPLAPSLLPPLLSPPLLSQAAPA